MSTVPTLPSPAVRPAFHSAAALMSVVCFCVAAVIALARPADGFLAPGACLAVGAAMGAVAVARYWSPRPAGRDVTGVEQVVPLPVPGNE